MKLDQLLQPWLKNSSSCDIMGLQNDSRQVKPGDLFIAYPGAAADGRLFMQQASLSGAAAILFDPEHVPDDVEFPRHIPCVPFMQLSSHLSGIASRFYNHPSQALSITGVTGTNGKTTIAYQLAQAYALLGEKAAYIGTLGQGPVKSLQPLSNTTPDALYLQHCLHDYHHQGIQHVCMEVSSHALCQGRVNHIDFTQAIYTNLSHEHLDYHHTMEAYALAKSDMFAIPSLKWSIINHDDAYAGLMESKIKTGCQKLTYGLTDGCDVRALHWDISMLGNEMEVVSPWGQHHFHVRVLGKFNVYNSLAVFSSLLASGVDTTKAVRVMSQLSASPGRMDVVAEKPCVIVDYAHTPDALDNVLATLSQLKQGKLIVVFGCGGDRDKTKRPMMGKIASLYADIVMITSDNPRTEEPIQIIKEIEAGVSAAKKVLKIIDRKEAIQHALALAEEKDIVLIAGKGHEDYQIIGKQRLAFSDQAVVRECLNISTTVGS